MPDNICFDTFIVNDNYLTYYKRQSHIVEKLSVLKVILSLLFLDEM